MYSSIVNQKESEEKEFLYVLHIEHIHVYIHYTVLWLFNDSD